MKHCPSLSFEQGQPKSVSALEVASMLEVELMKEEALALVLRMDQASVKDRVLAILLVMDQALMKEEAFLVVFLVASVFAAVDYIHNKRSKLKSSLLK